MQIYLIDNSARELRKKIENYKDKEAVRKKKKRKNFKIKSTSAKSFVSLWCQLDNNLFILLYHK